MSTISHIYFNPPLSMGKDRNDWFVEYGEEKIKLTTKDVMKIRDGVQFLLDQELLQKRDLWNEPNE